MKRVDLNFVRPSKWIFIWVAALLMLAAGTAAVGWTAGKLGRVTQSNDEAAQRIIAKVQELSSQHANALAAANADPTQAQFRKVQGQLQLDWSPVFATVENLREPGTRLVSLVIGSDTQTIQVEYEVESLAQAARLTSAMNAGLPQPAWKLASVSAVSAGGLAASERMRGIWRGQLNGLR